MGITGSQKQKATSGVRAGGCVTFFWLVGGKATTTRVVLSASCAQPEAIILHLGGGPSSVEELKNIVTHIFLSRNQDPASRLYHHLIAPPLFLYPLPSLISSYLNHPLELREGQEGWMKPRSYKKEMENTEQICTLQPHRILLSFNSGKCETMTDNFLSKWGIALPQLGE